MLDRNAKVSFKCMVRLEIKPEKTENRVLVSPFSNQYLWLKLIVQFGLYPTFDLGKVIPKQHCDEVSIAATQRVLWERNYNFYGCCEMLSSSNDTKLPFLMRVHSNGTRCLLWWLLFSYCSTWLRMSGDREVTASSWNFPSLSFPSPFPDTYMWPSQPQQ